MSGRARLIMWAALFIAALAVFSFCEGRYGGKSFCDVTPAAHGCPAVSPSGGK